MKQITFEEAWQACKEAEVRLPEKPPVVEPQACDELLDVLKNYDLFLVGAEGVLHKGKEPCENAITAANSLLLLGKKVHVITNDAHNTGAHVAHNLFQMGYRFTKEQITTSLDEISAFTHLPGQNWGYISTRVNPIPHLTQNLPNITVDNFPDSVENILMLGTGNWNEEGQNLLIDRSRQIKEIIVANPDVAEYGVDTKELVPTAGYYGHHLADFGVNVRFMGKPYRNIFEYVLRKYPGIPKERILVIGDSLHTDILGARAYGLDAMLVKTGVLGDKDINALCEESGIWPNYIADKM